MNRTNRASHMAAVTTRGKYWRAQIRRLGFPPQHKSFDTHAEAEAWARAAESQMDHGIFVSRAEAERTTLAEALERSNAYFSASRTAFQADRGRRFSGIVDDRGCTQVIH